MSAGGARKWQTTPSQRPIETPKKVSVKVKHPGWITKGEKVIYAFIAFVVIIVGIFMVSLSSATDTLNREIQALESQVQTQKISNEGLAFEAKELSRPERIIAIANEHGLKIQNSDVKQAKIVD